jgi:hypothetical protein
MSTDYRFESDHTIDEVLAAADKVGLKVHKDETKRDGSRTFALTDGRTYLWFYSYKSNKIASITRYGNNYNAPEAILYPIANELGASCLSEHDDGFFEDEGKYET